jgi:hypothetical protein
MPLNDASDVTAPPQTGAHPAAELRVSLDEFRLDVEARLQLVENHLGLQRHALPDIEQLARWTREVDRAVRRGQALWNGEAKPTTFEIPPSLRVAA